MMEVQLEMNQSSKLSVLQLEVAGVVVRLKKGVERITKMFTFSLCFLY